MTICKKIQRRWAKFFLAFSGLSVWGRLMTRFAEIGAPPYKGSRFMAQLSPTGYISSKSKIFHPNLHLGRKIFIGDGVNVYGGRGSGEMRIGDGAHIHKDCIIETDQNGSIWIGPDTHIQPRCQLSAYAESIQIGSGVQIAPNCGFYPYNHGMEWGRSIKSQPLVSAGPICLEDDVWIGFGVVVLENVRIGTGAVIGAGSIVTSNIPSGAIAIGNPARTVRQRRGMDKSKHIS